MLSVVVCICNVWSLGKPEYCWIVQCLGPYAVEEALPYLMLG